MHETYLSEKSLSEERYHSPKAGHIPFQEKTKEISLSAHGFNCSGEASLIFSHAMQIIYVQRL